MEQKSLRLTIVESPFAGASPEIRRRNLAYARRALLHSLLQGEAPIASHLLHAQVLSDNVPEHRELGIEAGLAWMEVAERVVFYVDYGMSPGMAFAKERALAYGCQIESRSIGKEAEA